MMALFGQNLRTTALNTPVCDWLTRQVDRESKLLLADQSGLDLERARRLIKVLYDELAEGL